MTDKYIILNDVHNNTKPLRGELGHPNGLGPTNSLTFPRFQARLLWQHAVSGYHKRLDHPSGTTAEIPASYSLVRIAGCRTHVKFIWSLTGCCHCWRRWGCVWFNNCWIAGRFTEPWRIIIKGLSSQPKFWSLGTSRLILVTNWFRSSRRSYCVHQLRLWDPKRHS